MAKATWEGWMGTDIPITEALDVIIPLFELWFETQIFYEQPESKYYKTRKVRVTVEEVE